MHIGYRIILFASCFYDYLLCYFLDEVVAQTAHLIDSHSMWVLVSYLNKLINCAVNIALFGGVTGLKVIGVGQWLWLQLKHLKPKERPDLGN